VCDYVVTAVWYCLVYNNAFSHVVLNVAQKASYPLLCNTLFGLIVLHYTQNIEFNV